MTQILSIAALLCSGVTFGLALAHALEMPGKARLRREDYATVQEIYTEEEPMTQKSLLRPLVIAAIAALTAWSEPASAGNDALDDTELARWVEALIDIRDMTPEWGVQGADAFKASSDARVPVFYLDVRKPEEWDKGVIENAVRVSLTDLTSESGLSSLPEDRTTIIAVYCKSGHRSALALPLLHQLGYVNAISLKGGYEAWVEAGYPVTGAKAE